METYRINFAANTITITKDFEDKLQIPDSEEYEFLKTLQTDFPGIRVVNRTHKTPAYYTNKKSGEKSIRNPFKNLKFKHMEAFMQAIPNNEQFLREYEFLKDKAAALQLNPYAIVREWFCAQFPKYKTNPLFYLDAPITLVKGKDVLEEAERRKASGE